MVGSEKLRLIEILLVEDNPGDVRLAQEALREHNMQNKLHVVHDGEQALRFLRHQGDFSAAPTPDLIMVDLSLPKLDGIELINEMQKDSSLRGLPVVVMGSSPYDRDLLRDSDQSDACFILKPVTLEQYASAVRCFPHLSLSIVSTAAAGGEKS